MTSTLDFPVTPTPTSDGFAQAELGFDPPARSSHGIARTPRGVSADVVQPDLGLDPAMPAGVPTQAERAMATGLTVAAADAATAAAAIAAADAAALVATATTAPVRSSGDRTAVLVPASVRPARDREGAAAGSRLAVALSERDCQGGGPVSTAVAGLPVRSRGVTTSPHRARSVHSATQDERGLVPAPPPSALGLLAQAEQGLTAAVRQPQPAARFAEAYLCALRAAAALLAARGRPHRGRAKPTSVWTLLSSVAPEMREWAAFFASCSTTRAAVQAGITSRVGPRAADDLVRQSGQFIALVHRAVHGDRR
jgi:hypothetical protein